jgi:hypothetical protein
MIELILALIISSVIVDAELISKYTAGYVFFGVLIFGWIIRTIVTRLVTKKWSFPITSILMKTKNTPNILTALVVNHKVNQVKDQLKKSEKKTNLEII